MPALTTLDDIRNSEIADDICYRIIKLARDYDFPISEVIETLVSRFGYKLNTAPHDELIAAAKELGIEL